MFADLERHIGCLRSGDGQADVLIGQLSRKRRRKIIVGGRGWHHSGNGVPRAKGPAVAGRNRRDVPEHLLVEAEAISQHCTFSGSGEIDEQHEVVADLCGLAGGSATRGNNIRRHRFDERAGISDGAGFPADHERQRSGLCTADSAGNGGVDKAESSLGCRIVKFLRGFNVNGGGVHKKGAGADRGQNATVTQVHGDGVLALGQHGEDDVDA